MSGSAPTDAPGDRPAPDAVRRILESRARTLAEPLVEEADQPAREVLAFRCGAGTYAVDVARVDEVLELEALTPVPGAPPALLGVVLHRGRVLSVVDLERLFEMPPASRSSGGLVIALAVPGSSLGVRADALDGIVATAGSAELGHGGERRDRVVERVMPGAASILDADALASDPRVVVDHDPGREVWA